MKRTVGWLIALILFSSLMGAGGVYLGMNLKSAKQLEAETKPPEPSAITAKIEKKVLENSVITRGVVGANSEVLVGLGRLLTEGSIDKTAGQELLTDVFAKVGDEIQEGKKVLEVDGRPLILLKGNKPSFRNITRDLEGGDVKQLQEALKRLGKYSDSINSKFDQSTIDATAKLYKDLGYDFSETVLEKELLFLPDVPINITAIANKVGYGIPEVLFKGSNKKLQVVAKINSADCQIARPETPAELYFENEPKLGKIVNGCVGDNSEVIIDSNEPIDFNLAQKDIKVVIKSRASEETLTVPLSAIFSNSAGELFVVKAFRDAGVPKTLKVPVKVGAKTAEETEIILKDESITLQPNDQVLVSKN